MNAWSGEDWITSSSRIWKMRWCLWEGKWRESCNFIIRKSSKCSCIEIFEICYSSSELSIVSSLRRSSFNRSLYQPFSHSAIQKESQQPKTLMNENYEKAHWINGHHWADENIWLMNITGLMDTLGWWTHLADGHHEIAGNQGEDICRYTLESTITWIQRHSDKHSLGDGHLET